MIAPGRLMPDPEHSHWYRPLARSEPTGSAVVFDLDGVIADAWHRQRLIHVAEPDWAAFFAASDHDPVIVEGRALAAAVDPARDVVILTARPHAVRDATISWLDRNDIRYDLLILRPEGDRRSSATYKRDELAALGTAGYTVDVALDDDRRIIAMYRDLGVAAVYVHSGYYDEPASPSKRP